MNTTWSDLNKKIQVELSKKETFNQGIDTLLYLRTTLFQVLFEMKKELKKENFYEMPFLNAKGYHNKSIAYALWHISRIEDIVMHTLILKDQQIFFSGNYQNKINTPIITTGNELVKNEILDFSKVLNIDALYDYISEVKDISDNFFKKLTYQDLKIKMSEEDKSLLKSLNVISKDDSAYWLVDYWCGKDIKGLIQMPFSRHWIMHVEASLRIREKIKKG